MAALATASVTVAAAATATTHVVWVAGTPPSRQELTASNGDVDAKNQQMQREETFRQAVQRGQDQLQHRPRQARQPQQGSVSSSDVHQQAQQAQQLQGSVGISVR